MKPSRTIQLQLNFDSRMLSALLVLAVIAALILAGGSVLGQEPADANDPAAQLAAAPAAGPAVADIAIDCGALLPTINGECLAAEALGAPEGAGTADGGAAQATGGGRQVYLTDAVFATADAKTACAAGYHMASLWEILDTSSWTYAATHPSAHNKADSGGGPPSNWYGWVRTGYDSSTSSTAGTGNCENWTTISDTAYGVSVRLSSAWETAPGDIGTWVATSFACHFTGPVWCAAD